MLIADDVPALRSLVRAMLEEDGEIIVVGEANNGLEAVAGVMAHRPDVLLLDLSMPQMDGMEVLFLLREKAPETKVIVLSGFGRDRLAPLAIELGAAQYVEKGIDGSRLRRVVLDVHEGTPTPQAA